MTTIKHTRISWIASRALPNRISSGAGEPALSRQWTYTAAIQAASQKGQWTLPWVGDESFSHLWEANLGGGYRKTSNWDKAWKRVVPLRAAVAPQVAAQGLGVSLLGHEYLFPSGVAAMLVADIQGDLTTSQLLEIAEQLGKRPVHSVGRGPGRPIPAVLGLLLDDTETRVFKSIDPESVPTRRLETVATVVATTGAPIAPLQQGDDAHQFLSALSKFTSQVTPETSGLLTQQLLPVATRYPDTARLSIGTSRAVWSPAQSEDPYSTGKLLCYHSNTSYSTLQVDLLLNTVRWATALGWQNLSQAAKDVLRPQLNLLGLLYTKAEVYTSRFVRRQIDESGLVASISDLRVQLGVGQRLS